MKARYFDFKKPIFITGFLAPSKLACVTNKIYEGTAMYVFPRFVLMTLAIALNSRMCAEDIRSLEIVSVRNNNTK